MQKRCSVCASDLREAIDRAIHAGDYTSVIAVRFGFTTPTVTGHRRSGHHLLQPRRVYTGPHTASSLLKKIEECRGDDQALRSLRLAVRMLPTGERRILVEELRRRAGRVEVVALRRVA